MKNNKGFTLVELLVTLGLITVISIISSDFLLNLVSASIKIQNKATLEQNYSFISSKLVKMIEDADDVTFVNSGKITISLEGTDYAVELKDGQILINNLPISSADNVTVSSSKAFDFARSADPVQVVIKLKFDIDSGSKRMGASQEFERIVTVRKSYKN